MGLGLRTPLNVCACTCGRTVLATAFEYEREIGFSPLVHFKVRMMMCNMRCAALAFRIESDARAICQPVPQCSCSILSADPQTSGVAIYASKLCSPALEPHGGRV